MSKSSKSRIKELQKQIIEARNDYYNAEPKLSDKHFDSLVDELKALDPQNPAVTMIGAPATSQEWLKAKHQIPMGSLDKVNLPEELIKWSESLESPELFVSEKLDGLSIEVIYEDGKFVQGISRGDGSIGDDLSSNVIQMQGVKKQLYSNFTGSLRGEIMMSKEVHSSHFSNKISPRNAASGISRRLDGKDCDKLCIIFYQVLGDVELKTEKDQRDWLINEGLSTPNAQVCQNVQEVIDIWRDYQDNIRETLQYQIDGLVVRVNDLDKQAEVGDDTSGRPRAARAFKFENATAETTLIGLIWQVGGMGNICPVAVLEPTILCDAKIERASLYNPAYIQELGLDVGAKVLISRANEIIPRVEEVVQPTGTIAKSPEVCPSCGEKTEMSGEYLKCPNSSQCPAQVIGRITNWINELNILEWGSAVQERLVESGKVKDVSDLYRLTVDDLASLERMGKKSAQKCYDLLWAHTDLTLDILLGALSIPLIGGSTIRTIMGAGYNSLDQYWNLTEEQLTVIPGIGPSRAQSLVKGLKQNKQLVTELLALGIKVKEPVQGSLSGKSICFTGKMENKRADLERWATEAGAEVKNSVGKGLSMLIIEDPEGSTTSKAVNARKFGVKLFSEADFLKMIGR